MKLVIFGATAGTGRELLSQASRADVADFMLRQLADDSYHRQTPGVSY